MKFVATIFFILALATVVSGATGHHELTNQMNTYAHRMATETAQAAGNP
jgi:hypothetical protein